jgi:hypothetical protein
LTETTFSFPIGIGIYQEERRLVAIIDEVGVAKTGTTAFAVITELFGIAPKSTPAC